MDLVQSQGSQWVGRVLSQAIQIWLRSQVNQVKTLKVTLVGTNRSILSGYLPKVSISATQAIYQGIHLSQVEAAGSNIRLNLSQVLRGKSLQLMERFPVYCTVSVSPADLRDSLGSAVVVQGLTEVLSSLFRILQEESDTIPWPEIQQPFEQLELRATQVELGNGQLMLKTQVLSPSGSLIPLSLETHLTTASPNELLLTAMKIQAPPFSSGATIEQLCINLGPDVEIQQLWISPEGLQLQGQTWVNP